MFLTSPASIRENSVYTVGRFSNSCGPLSQQSMGRLDLVMDRKWSNNFMLMVKWPVIQLKCGLMV